MHFLQIAILAIVQGFAELLPVSSSAHVIVAEKLMGLDPTTPEMTLLLVMLHTGTMFAVIVYFWKDWNRNYFQSSFKGWAFIKQVFLATLVTGLVGLGLKLFIEKVLLKGAEHAEVESLFGDLKLVSIALASAGLLILWAAVRERYSNNDQGFRPRPILLDRPSPRPLPALSRFLPVRGNHFDRYSLKDIQAKAEEFSFALAVVLTPPVVAQELHRLLKAHAASPSIHLASLLGPGFLGMGLSFLAGLLALRWLSNWLSKGRWKFFGIYCLIFAVLIWLFQAAS